MLVDEAWDSSLPYGFVVVCLPTIAVIDLDYQLEEPPVAPVPRLVLFLGYGVLGVRADLGSCRWIRKEADLQREPAVLDVKWSSRFGASKWREEWADGASWS